eukprot:4184356-Amphidinium_carterae.1
MWNDNSGWVATDANSYVMTTWDGMPLMPDFGNNNSGRVGLEPTSGPYSQIESRLTAVVRRFCGQRDLGFQG